jgi:hypothetical protein
VAVDPKGNVYVADPGGNSVLKLDFADPPDFHFAWSHVGSKSSDSPRLVTVFNSGNMGLLFPYQRTGANPKISGGFTLDGATTCPQVAGSSSQGVVATGSSCVYAVNFVPQAAGPQTGSLVMTDLGQNMPIVSFTRYLTQTIPLQGDGATQ